MKRTGFQNARLSRPRVAGAIASAKPPGTSLKSSGRVKSPRRAKKHALHFGGVPRNPAVLAFIRQNHCIMFGLHSAKNGEFHVCSGIVEAAHTGPRGRGQKAADETALPMCVNLHRTGRYAHHKLGKKFWEFHGLNQAELIADHNVRARQNGIRLFGDEPHEICMEDLLRASIKQVQK